MTTDAEIEEGAPEAAAPIDAGRRRKLLVMGGAAALVALAGGAGLYLHLSSGQGEAGNTPSAAAQPQTFIFNLQPITVNLNSEGGQDSFLRMTVALEVANEQVMRDIQPSLAKVVDAFQVYLRELRRSDLEGSAGIYRLKEELLRRVNLSIHPARIESILFRELLVQ